MDDLRKETARNIPGVTMGSNVEVYVVHDKQPNLEVASFRQGNHISTAVVITDSMLETLQNHNQLKAQLGHEFSHAVMKENPNVQYDPRLKLNTPEFNAAYADFKGALERNPFNRKEQHTYDILKDSAKEEFRQKTLHDKLEGFVEEARADKLGTIISKDPRAMHDSLAAINNSINGFLRRDFDSIPWDEKIAAVKDPHPPFSVRMAEVGASGKDMQHIAALGQGQSPSFNAPLNTPAQPSSQYNFTR